ncbi:MAG: hypothetical protein ACFFG0_28095 [Candidatus Thorarchaeota archaeon]
MLEKTQSFDMNGQNYEGIRQKIEHILQNDLMYSIDTKRLGKTLLRITYFNDDVDKEEQKVNRITILQETERRVYIQIMGQLSDDQIGKIWAKLEKDSNLSKQIKQKKLKQPSKEEIIQKITELINLKGYALDYNDAQDFVESFQQKYGRLPKNEEINSIVQGYVRMVKEDYLLEKSKTSNQNEIITEKITTIMENDKVEIPSGSYNNSNVILENAIERRKCPSCGDEGSIHEVTDKSIILLDYPRIYGKKKYCGKCGFEWRK